MLTLAEVDWNSLLRQNPDFPFFVVGIAGLAGIITIIATSSST